MEEWDISLRNIDTRTGLRMNGSSINKKKRKNNRHTYKQMIQVNRKKQLVLLPVQQAALKTGVSDGRMYRSKRREKMKFPTFTMNLRRLSIWKIKIIIDTGSSTLVMWDPAYCDKIEKSDKVLDLATNGGVMPFGMKCEVDKLGEAWFNKIPWQIYSVYWSRQ